MNVTTKTCCWADFHKLTSTQLLLKIPTDFRFSVAVYTLKATSHFNNMAQCCIFHRRAKGKPLRALTCILEGSFFSGIHTQNYHTRKTDPFCWLPPSLTFSFAPLPLPPQASVIVPVSACLHNLQSPAGSVDHCYSFSACALALNICRVQLLKDIQLMRSHTLYACIQLKLWIACHIMWPWIRWKQNHVTFILHSSCSYNLI